MIRIICPECKNGYLEEKDGTLSCPQCETHIEKSEENLILGIQYYNECDYNKANDYLMKYIVQNGAEPRAIFYKALCDGFCFDEDTLSLADTYDKLLEALKSTSAQDFPRYLGLANDETEKLEKAIVQSHIYLFADADAERIKKEVSAIINIQNDAKAFRVKLNALTNKFNDKSDVKLSVKFSECFFVEPEVAAQVGDLKAQKIQDNIASHTVFTGILSTEIKNLEIYYRCIVMFFKKNRQKYDFLMTSAEKFIQIATLLEGGQYNTIKGTAAIGEKLKSAGYEFFHESLKDADDDYSSQSETVIIIAAEPEETPVEAPLEDIPSVTVNEDENVGVRDADENNADESENSSQTPSQEDTPDGSAESEIGELIPDENDAPVIEQELSPLDTASEETEQTHQDEVLLTDANDPAIANEPTETLADEIVDENSVTVHESKNDEQEDVTAEVSQTEEAADAEQAETQINTPFETIEETCEENPKKEKNDKPKHKTHYAPFVALFAVIAGIMVIFCCSVIPSVLNSKNYENAATLSNQGKFKEAAEVYLKLDDYEDSQTLYKSSQYNYASQLEEAENYADAKKIYEELGEFEDSMAKATSCTYNVAIQMLDEGKFDDAKTLFASIPDYADSSVKVKECDYKKADSKIAEKKFEEAIKILEEIEDYEPTEEKICEAKYKYVEANPDKENKTTLAYIDYLIEARYKDSALLRKQVLGDDASVATDAGTVQNGATSVINYSATNVTENLTEADNSKAIYFHATLVDPELYGKNLTVQYTTAYNYTDDSNCVLTEENNTCHFMYPKTQNSNYTVTFSLIAPDGTVLVSQVITIK